MDIFKLYRYFWDFSFSNPEKIKPNHVAIYSFAIEHCNRLGWKKNFGFPTSMVLEATGIKSYSVFKKTFDELVLYGFFEVIEYSRNQYSSNIIALKESNKANCKALDKALITHNTKQVKSTHQSTDSIDKQIYKSTKETIIQIEAKALLPSEIIVNILNEVLKKEKGFRVLDENKAKNILKLFEPEEIRKAVFNATQDKYHIETNFQYLTPEFFTRKDKVEKFLNFTPYVKRSSIDNLKDNAREAIRSQFEDLSESNQAGEEDYRSNDLPVY